MKKPEPQVGLIIRFDYLWRDKQDQGHLEGAKDRPCAVIVALQRAEGGTQQVYVVPITHSPLRDGQRFVEMPSQFNSLTGLDHERS